MNIDLIKNSEFLKSLYPDGLLGENITIQKLNFSYNGPTVSLFMDTNQKPKRIPKKWPNDFDKVSLIFDISGLNDIVLSKWGVENKCSLELSKSGENLMLSLKGKDIDAVLTASFVYFKSISPFKTRK